MPQFCTECGSILETGKKFCTNCGTKVEGAEPIPAAEPPFAEAQAAPFPTGGEAFAPQNTDSGWPAYAQAAPIPPPGQYQGPYAAPAGEAHVQAAQPVGALLYLGYLILMNIPLAGLVMSIVWGVKPVPTDRRNLARAMIVINSVWFIIFILFVIWAYPIVSQIMQVVDISFKIFGLELFK